MDPSFHFQAEIPVAFYCFSAFLSASHPSTHFLLAPLSFEPHLYGAINPHGTEGRCHWRSLLWSQRCLSLKTSLQYFEFTPHSDTQPDDGKHQSEKRGLAFVSGWKGKVARVARAVPWGKTPFLVLGYLCLGQSPEGRRWREEPGCPHPPGDQGPCSRYCHRGNGQGHNVVSEMHSPWDARREKAKSLSRRGYQGLARWPRAACTWPR